MKDVFKTGDTNIDADKIKDLVGIPKFVYVHNIIKSITEKDVDKSLEAIDMVLEEGKDLENFLWEMIKHTKDILMYKVNKKTDIYNKEEVDEIAKLSENVSKEELINIIYKLSELENKMKMSSQKNILFEAEIIKLCMKIETASLEDRIVTLENMISNKNISITNTKTNEETRETETTKVIENSKIQEKVEPKKENVTKKVETAKTVQLSEGSIVNGWSNVLNNLKSQGKVMIYANLINTEAVQINDMTVAIRFKNGLNAFRKDLLEKSENMNILTKEISMICGKVMQIKLEDASSSKANKREEKQEPKIVKQEQEDILDTLDIPINFVEEE